MFSVVHAIILQIRIKQTEYLAWRERGRKGKAHEWAGFLPLILGGKRRKRRRGFFVDARGREREAELGML